jgi:hypothetical protein
MESYRGFIVKKRKGLSHWEALLEEWLLVNERYCRMMNGEDAAFFYTERACVGTLAAAAWRCGRIALEEFQYEKSERKLPAWLGRADLYIANDDIEEYVEAEYKWLTPNLRYIASSCKKVLADAVQNAEISRGKDKESTFIGAAFVPVYALPKYESNLNEIIEEAVRHLQDSNDFHALAWCFPVELRNFKNDHGNFTPGVFFLAKNIKYE